jgi:hypothetical protein
MACSPARSTKNDGRMKWSLFIVAAVSGCVAASPNPCAKGAGLDADACLLPWPSSAFLVADASTRTGFRVQLPAALMPVNDNGVAVDPAPWNRADGFSPMTTLFVEWSSLIDPAPLPTWRDPGPSLAADSPTVIIDVDSGERVAHFVELESSPEVAAGHTEMYLRPAARLGEGRHYAVGIRALTTTNGKKVAAGAPFRELRDKEPSSLESRRAAFERDVFAPLARAGVERASLQIAWDFRTASGETGWGDLVAMRDAAISAGATACSISNVVEDPNDPEILRQLQGQITIPNFLEGTTLARGGDGKPALAGSVAVPFTAIIPRSANVGAPLFIYGHGLFSDQSELLRDFGRDTASKAGAVAVATDYVGLTGADTADVVDAFLDLNRFPGIIDKLRQGIIDTILLPRAFLGCASLPQLQASGQPLIDGSNLGYFGNSMGGTLGSVIAALSPDVHRFALGVGGIDFPVMMPRTTRWPQLEAFYRIAYPTRLDRDLLIVMSATQWDQAESSSFATHVLGDPLPGSAPASLLFQVGRWDADTTNVASEIAGRTLGLPELTPTAHAVWGLAPMSAPLPSAYVVYDLGATPFPDGTLPQPENGVHEGVRRDPRAQAQIVAFLRKDGQVVDTCNGACEP